MKTIAPQPLASNTDLGSHSSRGYDQDLVQPPLLAATTLAGIVLVAIALSWMFPATLSAQDTEWKTYWKNGTRIESSDGQYAIKFGGRIQADFSFADEDDQLSSVGFEDGTEFRRARLFIEGTIHENVEFKIEYDFAGGDAAAKDVYVGLVGLPGVGGVRVGHFKEPFGLEELTSSKYITFVERSMPIEAFAPSRNMGAMVYNSLSEDRMTWALGAFKDTDDTGTSVSNEWNVTGRFTGLVVDGSDDGPLLHLGLAASRRSPVDDMARYRARPQAHLAPRLVDTGTLAADGADLLGLEAAFIRGPFWAAAEAMQARVNSSSPLGADADLSGFDLKVGWFITGESRPFKKAAASFDRVKPAKNFAVGQGAGAWELALRYADLDLSDGFAQGGEQDGLTLAVNWYLNSATRVMFNVARTEVTGSGTVDFFLTRFAIDF